MEARSTVQAGAPADGQALLNNHPTIATDVRDRRETGARCARGWRRLSCDRPTPPYPTILPILPDRRKWRNGQDMRQPIGGKPNSLVADTRARLRGVFALDTFSRGRSFVARAAGSERS